MSKQLHFLTAVDTGRDHGWAGRAEADGVFEVPGGAAFEVYVLVADATARDAAVAAIEAIENPVLVPLVRALADPAGDLIASGAAEAIED
jgi:hypothetical protein